MMEKNGEVVGCPAKLVYRDILVGNPKQNIATSTTLHILFRWKIAGNNCSPCSPWNKEHTTHALKNPQPCSPRLPFPPSPTQLNLRGSEKKKIAKKREG